MSELYYVYYFINNLMLAGIYLLQRYGCRFSSEISQAEFGDDQAQYQLGIAEWR